MFKAFPLNYTRQEPLRFLVIYHNGLLLKCLYPHQNMFQYVELFPSRDGLHGVYSAFAPSNACIIYSKRKVKVRCDRFCTISYNAGTMWENCLFKLVNKTVACLIWVFSKHHFSLLVAFPCSRLTAFKYTVTSGTRIQPFNKTSAEESAETATTG